MIIPASHAPNTRSLLPGTLAWLAFALLAVLIRGVRWEETYEHALIITRLAPYPEGHPAFIYWRNVFSGQSYLTALLLWCCDVPVLLNGLRNVLQLASCTIPVYLIGARLGGRPVHGHAAAALILLGVHQDFQSYYPIESWPHFYAVGQIGAGYTLLVLACLLHGWWRSAWFLLGLMPAIHIGQVPAIAAVAGLQGLVCVAQRDREKVVSAFTYLGLGLAPCVLFLIVQQYLSVPQPAEGAYAAEGDAHAIWAAYSTRYDLHRFVPRLNPFWKSGLGAGLAVLLLAGSALASRDKPERQRTFVWMGLFAAITSLAVGVIWLLHQALGTDTPFLLIGWMPYRLLNHLAVLLVPAVVGVLLGGGGSRAVTGGVLVGLVMLHAALYPVWEAPLPEPLFTRYAGNPEGLLFALFGAAAASICLAARTSRVLLLAWLPAGLVVGCVLAFLYPFGAAAAAGGALAWLVLNFVIRYQERSPEVRSEAPEENVTQATRLWDRVVGRDAPTAATRILAATAAILLAALLWVQWQTREHLPRQPIHAEVAQYLAERGEEDAMLVTPYWDVGWVGKTRHPVFADYQYAHLATYMPSLGPALEKMHEEVFGFVLAGETGPPLAPWPERTAGEWQQLGEAYGFQYVLAPSEMMLRISPVLENSPYDLYRVVP